MHSPEDPHIGTDDRADTSRVLTVPNVITGLRLAFLPLYWHLLVGLDHRVAAATLLAVLGATDWVDGHVARRFHQVSNLGKVLDPIADRLLFFVGIVGIIVVDAVPLWFCVAVLAREIVVASAFLLLAALGAKRIDVTWFGKAGTFGLMFAFPLLLGGSGDIGLAPLLSALGWIAGIPGLVFSYYAAALYLPLARTALADGRAHRAASQRPASG